MSIGGDIAGEVIALLQPVHSELAAGVREYGGELDDMDKDDFKLATTLYTGDSGENGTVPISTILVEFNGADHEAQDGSNIAYLTTYKLNVWIVVGYKYSLDHLEGGGALNLEEAYDMYDAVLDLTAGRRILKDAETVRLVRGERIYFGNLDTPSPGGDPFEQDELCAIVYKLEYTIAANSVWQEYPGQAPIRAPD